MQPCLQWLQLHADIFDGTSLMEKNDSIPQSKQTLAGAGVGHRELLFTCHISLILKNSGILFALLLILYPSH